MTGDIKNCVECGRPTRSNRARLADHPGTVGRGARGLCISCYGRQRPTIVTQAGEGPRIRDVAREIVFAVVEAPHEPQQSECRISCCKTPYMCAQGYRCGCHWRSRL